MRLLAAQCVFSPQFLFQGLLLVWPLCGPVLAVIVGITTSRVIEGQNGEETLGPVRIERLTEFHQSHHEPSAGVLTRALLLI